MIWVGRDLKDTMEFQPPAMDQFLLRDTNEIFQKKSGALIKFFMFSFSHSETRC